jgi:beta-aspartyl-peptidase (threonine type)
MEKSQHVLLAREGAEFFAKENGIESVNPAY